jgi:hypothetical protein
VVVEIFFISEPLSLESWNISLAQTIQSQRRSNRMRISDLPKIHEHDSILLLFIQWWWPYPLPPGGCAVARAGINESTVNLVKINEDL